MATKKRTGRTRKKKRTTARVPRRRVQRSAQKLEDVRRAPLDPALPLNPDAPVRALDPDALDVLHDTQEVAPDEPDDRKIVGPDAVDRRRGTVLTGGDVDAAWDETDAGEETVGGSAPTPDQDVVDDLGRAAGVTYSDSEPLRPEEKEAARDEKRWENDPASSEDYPERVRALRRKAPSGRRR